ncbi:carbamoyltransferase HypF [Oscillospiraceae bacterium LTW-04]|nr:carbamoyltransferase HypF [Oscillospiraceae bacterium MB24-C1]
MAMDVNDARRYLINLTGIVQGVGFRPFVFRIAQQHGLKGWVENQGSRVLIDIEGKGEDIREFTHKLQNGYPQNARIAEFKICEQPFWGYSDFLIKTSCLEANTANFLPQDVAVCESCMKEFNTPGDKRFQYPFISCTDCGPRYSIISSLPYDRKSITMSAFEMCPQCASEYSSPSDRRYHAQTNCCPHCGPELKLLDANGNTVNSTNPAKMASQLIYQGKILAVKGIGGYHLCCNAESSAIQRLRKLKNRPHKPLAIMARNIEAVKRICKVSEKEEEILTGIRKPILLLYKRIPEYLPQVIAPNQKKLGVMLPYAPLHSLIFAADVDYLIMTSGNISGSPICYKECDALSSLKNVADYFLTHNREITVPVDDAVVKVVDMQEVLVRCGRGYAPLTLPIETNHEILAVGAQQKCSVCITREGFAAASQYIGDLNEYKTFRVFEQQINHFKDLFGYCPEVFAHDLNLDYLSSRYAKNQIGQKIAVQHHHAHMVGCMAENKLTNDVIGVIYDGTGLGTDSAIWGAEFFVGSLSRFTRAGHLQYVKLQGGDSAVKEPWRCAASYLLALGIEPHEFLPKIDPIAIDAVKAAISNNIKCFESSSMGRFFDCVAALCGFFTNITYDAQAAIELENLSYTDVDNFYTYCISETENGLILEYDDILKDILTDIQNGALKQLISAKFHNTVVEATAECICKIRKKTGLNDVVLSGGVFENTYLLERLILKLRNLNFNVYYNRLLPTNDGGISFGQAVAASAIIKENNHVSCCSCKSYQNQ